MNYTKQVLFLILLTCLVAFPGCFGKKTPPPPPPPSAGLHNVALQNYLRTLEQTIAKHDVAAMMELMDRDYVKGQHDKNLEGRTKQFIDELFCGNETQNDQYMCIPFTDVNKANYTAIVDLEDGYSVFYEISSANKTISLDWWITAKIYDGKIVYGIYGALG